MKCIEHRIKFNAKSQTATILATSCWHIGNPAIHQAGIDTFIKRAKKHDWLHHGDMIEGITPYDKRYEADAHNDTIFRCMSKASSAIKKAQTNCIGVLKGNHEATPSKDFGDVAEKIAMDAGVPYLSATCFIKFICPDGEFTGFFCHGNGTANYRIGEPERKQSNKKIRLRDILKDFHADICGMGHMHKSIATPPAHELRLSMVDGKVKRRPITTRPGWYYAAPSMFKTYDTDSHLSNYGEMKIYPAVDLGWIEFDVDRAGNIQAIREIDDHGNTIETSTPMIAR